MRRITFYSSRMNQDDMRHSWDAATNRLARRVNLGWWLQHWLPVLIGTSMAAALALLVLRSLGVPQQNVVWITLVAVLVLAMLAAWHTSRRRFEDLASARVRLEDALNLRSRLTAAAGGVGPWPAYPVAGLTLPVTWRWERPAGAVFASAALLTLAVYLPVPARVPPKPHIIEKPSSVKQVEQWVEELRKDEAVAPQELAEIKKKVEDLLRRPNEKWYEHASLEAADHLRDETGKALQELGTQLEQTQASLTTLAEMGGQLSQEAKEGLAKQAQNNLAGLRSGALQANSSLTDQLKNMDPKALQGMSKEQLDKLAQRLKQNAEALRKTLASAPQFSFKECQGGNCNKPGSKPGNKPGDKPGQGDPTRGKADAELTLQTDENNLNTKRTEMLNTMLDAERVTPGDLLQIQDAKPTVDPKNYAGLQSGGGLQSTGEGGAAVEKATLVPAERAVLKRFFK